MNIEKLRRHCLAFPGTTEQIQWGADLVFKVGGKMFCVACTEAAPNVMSFKCDDETFAELCEREGIIPAPYMARAKWVALQLWDTLEDRELMPLIDRAYALVKRRLPKRLQAALDSSPPGAADPARAPSRSAPPEASGTRRVSARKAPRSSKR